jgi:hypothetical protein
MASSSHEPRIEQQATAVMTKQALMIASQELGLLTYRQPYHLGHASQRRDLIETVRSETGMTVVLPVQATTSRMTVYLIFVDGHPMLMREDKVLAWLEGFVLGRAGHDAAARVSYESDMMQETWADNPRAKVRKAKSPADSPVRGVNDYGTPYAETEALCALIQQQPGNAVAALAAMSVEDRQGLADVARELAAMAVSSDG